MTRELRALTGLRFVAALHVLVYHAVFTFSRTSVHLPRGAVRSLLGSGYVSVGLFFVLSGFVLAYSYAGPSGAAASTLRGGARRFFIARFARIYPMHALGLLVVFPLFCLGSLEHNAPLPAVAHEGAKQLAASALLVQAWIPSQVLALNGPAWSLSCEAFFYLCFPLLAFALGRAPSRVVAVVAVCAWGLAMWPPLFHHGPANVERMTPMDLVVLYDPLARLPDFVVGVAAGLLFVRNGAWARAPKIGVAATVAIVTILANTEVIPFALLHDGLLDPLFALLIASLASRGSDASGLGSEPLVALGRASFSLYVLHKPLYFWLARGFGVQLLPPTWFLGAYVCVAVVLSALAWRAVEEPLRRWITARFAPA